MATGNPFANVVAQDIMEPFPAILECDAEAERTGRALRRSGIPVRPYVDREGRLVGVAADNKCGGRNAHRLPGRGQWRDPRPAGNDSPQRQLPGDLRSVLFAGLCDTCRYGRGSSARAISLATAFFP